MCAGRADACPNRVENTNSDTGVELLASAADAVGEEDADVESGKVTLYDLLEWKAMM